MSVKFQVEKIINITERGYFIVAKLIREKSRFWLPENSKLGKIEITSYLNKPRAFDQNGNIRTDLWAFKIKDESDFNKLNEGDIIELFPGDEIKFLPP